jgi:hypothetical protein
MLIRSATGIGLLLILMAEQLEVWHKPSQEGQLLVLPRHHPFSWAGCTTQFNSNTRLPSLR